MSQRIRGDLLLEAIAAILTFGGNHNFFGANNKILFILTALLLIIK